MKSLLLPVCAIALSWAAVGCKSYSPLPFDAQEILTGLKDARSRGPKGPSLSFMDAAKRMDEANLELKKIQADYQTLKAVADLPTPLSNPEIELGPAIGHRLGDTPRSTTQPFVSLGFAIPLGPRLSREDDLNAIRAQSAKIATAARHRDLYLSLRHAYANHALANARMNNRRLLTEVIESTAKTSKRLRDAEAIGTLEFNRGLILNTLDSLGRIDDELEAEAAAAALAELLALSPATLLGLATDDLPTLPAALPNAKALEQLLIENNTKLSALRMAFWESDAELKLELAKQYPDLNLGFGFEQEPGEKAQTFEIGIGIELPVFDRNKQGIARAVATRKAAKAAYENALGSLLTQLEHAVKAYTLHQRKLNAMKELLPLAHKTQQDARRLTEVGTFDFMRYLDISKAYVELTIQTLEQKSKVWDAMSTIETIVGSPLVPFPGHKITIRKRTDEK